MTYMRAMLTFSSTFLMTTSMEFTFLLLTLCIFKAKVVAQLLYWIQIWISAFNKEVERILSTLLYRIFGLPHLSLTLLSVW